MLNEIVFVLKLSRFWARGEWLKIIISANITYFGFSIREKLRNYSTQREMKEFLKIQRRKSDF